MIVILMCLLGATTALPVFAQNGSASVTMSLVVPLHTVPGASQPEYSSITVPATILEEPVSQEIEKSSAAGLQPVSSAIDTNMADVYQVWVHI